ncbi:GNAT family N-acetyltransferase [Ferrimonas sp. YFM]|uniref:GNAT family N-acetyltransferase n=1 Tax=Ferrimonas sp. YFM TaxID=3028878 RepID=UPI0025728453|nr:GNAT family N-acetyltransferase [Ferrimonas sp. YFM]BDY04679.1 N-acetyltransferase [Ferrimonas sp. YFM]
MKIEVTSDHNAELFDALVDGVRQFNAQHMGDETSKPLMVCAKDKQGRVVGGVAGRTIYRQFLIEVLWVSESCRGTGLGRTLMVQAEEEARRRGCIAAQVDTLQFQAPDFYQKLGFEVIGQVTDVPPSPDRVFLFKRYV